MPMPRLVLMHPRNADNLVSIAGAMRHFGLTDWVVVTAPKYLDSMQSVLTKHREPNELVADVMKVRRVDTLADAVADCSWVVGTTMRVLEGRPRVIPRELAALSAERGDERWALVFGAEANGLQNDEVDQCHAVSFIPSDEAQPSLNLSQAVVVYANELAQVPSTHVTPGLATDASLRDLRAACIDAARLHHGLFDPETLLAPLLRGPLTRAETERWSAAFRLR
ncbi:MAG TPA: RNA methyltransferase [Archangium sp.]